MCSGDCRVIPSRQWPQSADILSRTKLGIARNTVEGVDHTGDIRPTLVRLSWGASTSIWAIDQGQGCAAWQPSHTSCLLTTGRKISRRGSGLL